VRQPI
jgi:hypothetical protein